MSIPKTIHYCWYGRAPKSDKMLRCMESWRKHHPDYEIVEWNEDNCDIAGNEFTKGAFEAGKWSFVADYFRLKAIYDNGGIYFDKDMMVHKPLDEFLQYDAFFSIESYKNVSGGVIASLPENEAIGKMLGKYEGITYKNVDQAMALFRTMTEVLRDEYGYRQTGYTQFLEGNIAVFAPNIMIVNLDDGENYCEHLYEEDVSWADEKAKPGFTFRYTVLKRYFYNLYGRPISGDENKKSAAALKEDTQKMIARYGMMRVMWQALKSGIYGLLRRRAPRNDGRR